MKNLELLSCWLKENMKVKIHHTFGSGKFEFSINYEKVNLDDLSFFSDPLSLCQEAASALNLHRKLDLPIAGKISTSDRQVLFQYFPGTYGFSAVFSLLVYEEWIEPDPYCVTFESQLRKIFEPGWHDASDNRFTKFELLCDRFNVKATDALDIVREERENLVKGINSAPAFAGGHMSDNFTWYESGLDACDIILSIYEH